MLRQIVNHMGSFLDDNDVSSTLEQSPAQSVRPRYNCGCPYYPTGCDDGFDEFSCSPCLQDYFSHLDSGGGRK